MRVPNTIRNRMVCVCVCVWYLDRIFVTYGIPERNVFLTGKSPEGKRGRWPWLTPETVRRPYQQVYVNMSNIFGIRALILFRTGSERFGFGRRGAFSPPPPLQISKTTRRRDNGIRKSVTRTQRSAQISFDSDHKLGIPGPKFQKCPKILPESYIASETPNYFGNYNS